MSLSNSTTSLESQISSLTVSPGTAACVWLGQGGYLFKSPQGVTVMVDAYLSDYAEAIWGVHAGDPAGHRSRSGSRPTSSWPPTGTRTISTRRPFATTRGNPTSSSAGRNRASCGRRSGAGRRSGR